MIRSRRLAARLTRTLEVKAAQAMPAETPDGRVPSRAPGRVPTGRRRVLLPAAALIVVAALVGAGAVALRDSPGDEPASVVTLGDPPDGWLVPTWVPDGMDLWGVQSSESSESSDPPGGQGVEPGTLAQLFGDPDGGRAIYVTAFRYDVRADTAEGVTVRGQTGQAGTSWDVEEADMGDAVAWEERGVSITALYQGATRDEVIATLDSLEWRSGDPGNGFAPPSGGSWPLRGEVRSRQPGGRDLSLLYSEGAPSSDPAAGRPGLRVHTSSSSAVSAEYLEAWYEQGSEAEGGERPLSTYAEDGDELIVLWPDGRSIIVSPTSPPQPGSGSGSGSGSPSRATWERIAESLTVATEAEVAALRDRSEANIASLPVLASATTGIGGAEVHGEGRFLALCLRVPGRPRPSCRADRLGGGSSADGNAVVTANWTVDGAWYVVVASTGDEPRIVGGRDRSASPDAGELPAEATAAGEWTIRLVRVAPDVQIVCTADELSTSCIDHRPG